MGDVGRPYKWGRKAKRKEAWLPDDCTEWLDAWAKGRGFSRSEANAYLLRAARREGTSAQKVMQLESELEAIDRAHRATALRAQDLTTEVAALKAANKGLRDRMGVFTRRIKARVPAQFWSRIFERGDLDADD